MCYDLGLYYFNMSIGQEMSNATWTAMHMHIHKYVFLKSLEILFSLYLIA